MLIAGNWKMFKGPSEASAFCADLGKRLEGLAGVDVVVCPPSVSLATALASLTGTGIAVYAQNAHWLESGPFTGEVAPEMLAEARRGGHTRGPF